jgi:hypothetical protein
MSMIKEKPEYKPPWFTLQVIGIAGASASGKTSVAKALVKKLNVLALPLFLNFLMSSGALGCPDINRFILQAIIPRGISTGI